MENLPKFTVNHIIEILNGEKARVTICKDIYDLVSSFQPALPFKIVDDPKTGQPMRAFNINGINLYSQWDRNARRTFFYMKADQAKEIHVPRGQASSGEKAPFSTEDFDKTVISNAVTA